MIFTIVLLCLLGAVVVGGVIFTALHPNLQKWGEGVPNKSK